MSEFRVRSRPKTVNTTLPFAALPHDLVADPRLTPVDKCVVAALLYWARDKSTCWPSDAAIGRRISRHVVSVQRSFRRIEKIGLIARTRIEPSDGNRTGRIITLLWRKETAPPGIGGGSIPGRKSPKKLAADSLPLDSSVPLIFQLPLDQLLAVRAEYLRSLGYEEYLLTSHWRDCRARAIARAGDACQVCNSSGELEVHHRTYARLGEEADADLIALCRPCHALFHGKGDGQSVDTGGGAS